MLRRASSSRMARSTWLSNHLSASLILEALLSRSSASIFDDDDTVCPLCLSKGVKQADDAAYFVVRQSLMAGDAELFAMNALGNGQI